MEVRVRDVYFNIHTKGKVNVDYIDNEHNGKCKEYYNLGNGTCTNRDCVECMDILMVNLEEEDERAEEYYEEECENGCTCEGCNGNDCEQCEDHDMWCDD